MHFDHYFLRWPSTESGALCRQYAAAISALLDPAKEFFGDRIVANAGFNPTEGATAAHLIKRLDAQASLIFDVKSKPCVQLALLDRDPVMHARRD